MSLIWIVGRLRLVFKMLSSALISGIILKTFCEFEGFDLAKDDIKEKALRDTKRDEIFH